MVADLAEIVAVVRRLGSTLPSQDNVRRESPDVARRQDDNGPAAVVISVSRDEEVLLEQAFGMANLAYRVSATVDTRFAMASGSKGFTALLIAALAEEGRLSLDTCVRGVLGLDLPRIEPNVTIEQLLTHTSGIGDYLDENPGHDVEDYVLSVPVHRLVTPEQYLTLLERIPPAFPAGERFAYNNSGYVVLALVAQRVAGRPFHDLVQERVLAPAGMERTGYLRSDLLPGDTALGYLRDGRTNVFHLPVIGSGDGGAYTTVGDMRHFWRALFAGRIVPQAVVANLTRPRNEFHGYFYGAGFWIWPSGAIALEGSDAGVSFRSLHQPKSGVTCTVIANTSDGAWEISRRLSELLEGDHDR